MGSRRGLCEPVAQGRRRGVPSQTSLFGNKTPAPAPPYQGDDPGRRPVEPGPRVGLTRKRDLGGAVALREEGKRGSRCEPGHGPDRGPLERAAPVAEEPDAGHVAPRERLDLPRRGVGPRGLIGVHPKAVGAERLARGEGDGGRLPGGPLVETEPVSGRVERAGRGDAAGEGEEEGGAEGRLAGTMHSWAFSRVGLVDSKGRTAQAAARPLQVVVVSRPCR